MELIDREALDFYGLTGPELRLAIEEAEVIDAVQVVRCKDCKHSGLPAALTIKYGEPGTLTCKNYFGPCNRRNINENDFCPYGEGKV